MASEDRTEKFEGFDELERRLNALERRFEERGYDTRPIYEAHEDRLTTIERSIQDLQKEIQNLRASSGLGGRIERLRSAQESQEVITVVWWSGSRREVFPECRVHVLEHTYVIFQPISAGRPLSGEYKRITLTTNDFGRLQADIEG